MTLLALLSKPDDECSTDEHELKETILSGYDAIKNNPFQPHTVARTRFLAYQYCVVMKYLDNLIAWGDSLFMQDTIESINEATQLLCARGQSARASDRSGSRRAERSARRPSPQLKEQGLDAMGNALVELEGQFPFNFVLPQTHGQPEVPPRVGRSLASGVPCTSVSRAMRSCWLLGYRGRPAVQDPPLHEYRGGGAAASALRSAARPWHVGQSGSSRDRHRHDRQRPEPAARPGALCCC